MANEKRLIDANALLDALGYDPMKFWAITPESTFGIVLNASTVDAVEVVHGRWREKILVGGFAEEWGYVCSECGCTVSDRSNLGIGRYASKNQRLNYCPNCGAKMDGDWNA